MYKDFDQWNTEKKSLQISGKNRFYHEREIWWCSLGINIGFEEDGKGSHFERPVVVIRPFSKHLCWVVPLSTSTKSNPYYIPIGQIQGQSASAIISQMRPLDTKRFINRIGHLDHVSFERTKQAIKDLL